MRALLLEDRKENPHVKEELLQISRIIGYDIVDTVRIRRTNGYYKISDYKINELKEKAEKYDAVKIIIEPALPPSQKLRIIKGTGREVLDRVAVILELFDMHAGSMEARLQIELARMRHTLPLIREIVNQAKRGEMPGFLAGGAYAVDKYYLYMKRKIASTRRKLEEIRRKRDVTRKRRKALGRPTIALVGYANAGKTTIFNRLTGYKKPVGDKLFTTLTPKTGRMAEKTGAFLIDTVGFIIDVPPTIIEAFYSTLEEIVYADALFFIIDSSENWETVLTRIKEGAKTLSNIDSLYKPVYFVLNKIDLIDKIRLKRLEDNVRLWGEKYLPETKGIISVSGKKGWGIVKLVKTIWEITGSRRLFYESVTGKRETRE